ncbi:Hypothetical predicted protein, partial [Marmota monax]
IYFHAFKRRNHLSPHKRKRREEGEAAAKRGVGTRGLGRRQRDHRRNVQRLSPQPRQSPALHTRQFEI